jgi:DNA-directed RNA polymerase subunit RPC12/RpoP
MVDKDYKCVDCGHAETVSVPDDWKEQRMYLPCPDCGNRVGMKMVIDCGSHIQKYGNQKGMSTWEEIKNRNG